MGFLKCIESRVKASDMLRMKLKDILIEFVETGVEEYLVALRQKSICVKKRKVTSSLRKSMKLLPETGNIWRMTFGLLALEPLKLDSANNLMKVSKHFIYHLKLM